MEISIYAIPGTDVFEKRKQPTPDEFVQGLNLKSNILLPKQKFQKMWPIFKQVCELYGENPVEVYQNNKSRDRKYVEIRQLSITLFQKRLCKNDYDRIYSLRVLGEFFGKDHATCIYAVKTIENLRSSDKSFRVFTNELFT